MSGALVCTEEQGGRKGVGFGVGMAGTELLCLLTLALDQSS